MPRIEEGKEVLSWFLWDSITLGGAAVEATLFAEPLGQATKSMYNTNMRNSGRMPWPETITFETLRFSLAVNATIVQCIALMKGTLSLVIGNKSYLDLRLFEVPSGGGLDRQSELMPVMVEAAPPTFPAGTYIAQSGLPDQSSVYPLSVPLTLEPGENFRVDLVWPSAPGAIQFWVGFDTTLRRSIQ